MADSARGGATARFARTVEIAANLATLVVAVLVSVALFRAHLLTTPPSQPQAGRAIAAGSEPPLVEGSDLSKRLSGIEWNRNRRTLILALSTHCHFCTESAPFFRRVRKSLGKSVTLIAVLPEPVADAESYLKGEGVQLDQVRQVSLNQIGVAGTPTMLLVNERGIVVQTWVGRLAPDKQREFFKTILSAGPAATSAKAVAALEAPDGAPPRAASAQIHK